MHPRFRLRPLFALTAVLACASPVAIAHAATATPAAKSAKPAAASNPSATSDPYLWLEEVTSDRALEWAKARNAESTKELATGETFQALESRFQQILDSDAQIPYVQKIGDLYYNLWKDKSHERGLWRRTTPAEYRKENPIWETVLDVDSLMRAENEKWVWEGVSVLEPDRDRCLIRLSRGGSDASTLREFDLRTLQFVPDGFNLPESKSSVGWRDRDHLYLGAAFDSTTMTTSGYPRVYKLWTRGTPVSSATMVFEIQPTDVSAFVFRDHTPGFERDFLYRGITFYTNETFLLKDGKPVKIEKPEDAEIDAWREWMLIRLRKPWTVGAKTFPAGALLATKFDDFMAGKRDLEMLFEPSDRVSLDRYIQTRNAIVLSTLDNVKSRISTVRPQDGKWVHEQVTGLPEFASIDPTEVDPYTSDDYFLRISDFLTPTSLHIAKVGGGAPEKLKQLPSYFDTQGLVVRQEQAVSKDGTHIPYFIVGPKDLKADGTAPTMMFGYGGFEVSETPDYTAIVGAGWLERGGVYVLANIRGGGEFGPLWHEAGVKTQRHHCYEDFAAVARDLIQRKITSPSHLVARGGSNGGLLMGNMLVQYPELFRALLCRAPLLDMRRYHTLLAGASWMGEYGNPDDPKEWAYIQKWSPYQLAKKGPKYPPILFTTSTRDDRVHPGHARKMAQKLRDQGHEVLYYENIEGGHGGASTHKQEAFMNALGYTFLWNELGGVPKAAHADARPEGSK